MSATEFSELEGLVGVLNCWFVYTFVKNLEINLVNTFFGSRLFNPFSLNSDGDRVKICFFNIVVWDSIQNTHWEWVERHLIVGGWSVSDADHRITGLWTSLQKYKYFRYYIESQVQRIMQDFYHLYTTNNLAYQKHQDREMRDRVLSLALIPLEDSND